MLNHPQTGRLCPQLPSWRLGDNVQYMTMTMYNVYPKSMSHPIVLLAPLL